MDKDNQTNGASVLCAEKNSSARASTGQSAQSTHHENERTFFLEVFGCQMNVYEGQLIEQMLTSNDASVTTSYRRVSDPLTADILLFHTCAIREKAFQTISRRILSLQYLQRQKERPIFGVLGCLAQSLQHKIWQMGLPVDLIVGPDNYKALPELLEDLQQAFQKKNRERRILTKLSRNENYDDMRPMLKDKDLSAFVTIMRGCDNFCSFCIVPYTRGRERSRSPQQIIDEVNYLRDTYNIKEVTLLGQNVNSYRTDDQDFTNLLEMLLKRTSVPWIRFTSPHPKDFPEPLLQMMGCEKRLCSQIHIPLQSGATRILQKMNRSYSQKQFLNLIEKMRSWIPDVGLSTDVIVGFCEESQEDFSATLDVMRAVEFDMAYMFRYSDREHTLAHRKLKDNVPETVKSQRLTRLIDLQQGIALQKNRRAIGKTFEVLIEGDSKRSIHDWQGKSECGKRIFFTKPAGETQSADRASNDGPVANPNPQPLAQTSLRKGDFAQVQVISSTAASFRGEFVGMAAVS